MSRSQGAANSGWPAQRHPAGEPDPRTGGRPAAARPQTPQYAPPQQGQAPGYPQQQPGHPQQGYREQPQTQPPAYGQQQAYHYPQTQPGQPQYAPAPAQQPAQRQQPATPQYAPQAAPAAATQPQGGRQGLSSLDSARNAQPTHDFDNIPRTQPSQYGRPQHQSPAQPQPQRAAYAAPASESPRTAPPGYRQAASTHSQQYDAAPQYPGARPASPSYEQWPPAAASAPAHDPYGQDLGGYLPADSTYAAGEHDALQQGDWSLPASGYGDPALDQQAYGHGQFGYDQPQGGALEPTYNQQEEGAYETEEPRRRSWTLRIAGAIVVAIGMGYGFAQAYKAVLGSAPSDSAPPVITSDASPAKELPADPGGKQFPHGDSKVLGRLGDDGSPAPADHGDNNLSESDSNSNGARQVKTLVVGRDGQIAAPPAAEPVVDADQPVSVPGLTVVDAFGSAAHSQPPPQRSAPQPPPEPEITNAQPRGGLNVKSTRVIPTSTASLPDEQSEAPAAAPPKKRVAVAAPPADSAPARPAATAANGYVVVLASVPASATSRLDALRKFADMQQQYGAVLGNKTPDVRETTLAGKGPYHRLLVGPPGSRTQANDLCTQLKAYGYKDCWVTAY